MGKTSSRKLVDSPLHLGRFCPWLERHFEEAVAQEGGPRRFFKSHEPPHLLPLESLAQTRNTRVVVLFRDPRDVCVSQYHHWRSHYGEIKLEWADFVARFCRGEVGRNFSVELFSVE